MVEREPAKHRSSQDDVVLVERAQAGDTQAFEELVRRHERRVYRTVLSITGNQEDAEDAMQETFLRLYQHLGEFQGASRFTTWLTRIAINEGLQKLRKRKPMQSLDEPKEFNDETMPRQFGTWHENPEELYAQEEIRRIVQEAINSLPPAYRVVFMLRDVEGLSTEEAAEALGLGVAALKSRILRARLLMRERLAERFQRAPTLAERFRHAGQMLSMMATSAFSGRQGGLKGRK